MLETFYFVFFLLSVLPSLYLCCILSVFLNSYLLYVFACIPLGVFFPFSGAHNSCNDTLNTPCLSRCMCVYEKPPSAYLSMFSPSTYIMIEVGTRPDAGVCIVDRSLFRVFADDWR